MTNHISNKPVVMIKERKILIEFFNSDTPGLYEMMTCEVMATESSKTDLSKYSVILSSDKNKFEVPAETFLYKLTSARKTKLNDNVKYKRNNIWEVEFFINGESESIKIEYFDEVIQAVYSILKRTFQFFDEMFESYEYLYLPQLFKIYMKSYDNDKEICEKFYETLNNKLKTNSFEEFIEVCEFLVQGHDASPEKSKDICDCFIDCAKNAIPHHFSRYVLTEYFTDDQIFDCYGGKEQAVEYLDRVLGKNALDDTDVIIPLLKKLTFDRDNKQFDNKVYMKHLIKTMEHKSQDLFTKSKKSWRSYSDMIHNTVSKLMRLEKDKTTMQNI